MAIFNLPRFNKWSNCVSLLIPNLFNINIKLLNENLKIFSERIIKIEGIDLNNISNNIIIEFLINLNEKNNINIYNLFKEWSQNNLTGYIEIEQYNRNGDIFRRIKLIDCNIISKLKEINILNEYYNLSEPLKFSIIIKCNSHIEEY